MASSSITRNDDASKNDNRRVGLIFDKRMCKHRTPDGEYHPENPNRLLRIWKTLHDAGVTQRCVIVKAKEAKDKHILSVHTEKHVNLIKNVSAKKFDSRRKRIAEKFNSIYLNEGSTESALIAAGSVIEACERVAKGNLNSAIALVRPPGHHAEEDVAMGFCLFNNVAIGTSFLLNERSDLGIKKVLIVDWDVHHGNGTQKMFWKDQRVLFFSVHRHEFGSFYPSNDDGCYTMIGEGPGRGYNINVPWEQGLCGDADYLAVWDHILLPVAKDFNPDIIIVSAGFDAAVGDPLGGCRVTPYGYAVMLKKLMTFSQGKIVMALEGGYNLNSIAKSVLACAEALLEDKPVSRSLETYPFESTWRVIQAVRKELSPFWPAFVDELPKELISQITPVPDLPKILSSESESEEDMEAPRDVSENFEEVIWDFSLMQVRDNRDGEQVPAACPSWRSELSKIDIWYAAFGSNMWRPRFLCYIGGGQVEGMQKPCAGSKDMKPPKEVIWRTYHHRLFFGQESTKTWGPGGVAFLHPESNLQDKTSLCLYRITLEQFNDVLLQENHSVDSSSPVFDMADLEQVARQKSLVLDILKGGWYHNVVFLGEECDIPILTMTCSLSDANDFKSGKLPMHTPSKGYANTLIKGLVEGERFTEEEAKAYIQKASSEPL